MYPDVYSASLIMVGVLLGITTSTKVVIFGKEFRTIGMLADFSTPKPHPMVPLEGSDLYNSSHCLLKIAKIIVSSEITLPAYSYIYIFTYTVYTHRYT